MINGTPNDSFINQKYCPDEINFILSFKVQILFQLQKNED